MDRALQKPSLKWEDMKVSVEVSSKLTKMETVRAILQPML
jgi:hypothetical protein